MNPEINVELEEKVTPEQDAVNKFLCTYIIPDNKMEPLEQWLKDNRKKNPSMKPERLLRKAAEYFRFKRL